MHRSPSHHSERQHETSNRVQRQPVAARRSHHTPAGVVALQRTAGNAAVSRMIQAKLIVGAANDPLEREADRVADRVASGGTAATQAQTAGAQGIHRNAVDDDELMTKRDGKDGMLDSFEAGSDFQSKLNSAGGGQPLDGKTRAEMEAGIGADFSSVRIHTGSHASQLNRSISAQAFTRGSDVFFDSGKYNPGSAGGKRLLAHELTHVVQQGGAAQGKSAQRKTTDIQRLRGVNEERDLPQVILATNILHQTVEKGRYQSLGSETVFENGLIKAKSALEPVPYIGLKSTTHDYFTAVGNMRDAAKRLSKKDDTLMDKEKEEGKWQKGISAVEARQLQTCCQRPSCYELSISKLDF